MKERPDFIKNSEELRSDESFSYPGDTETFGTGAALGRALGLSRVAINYEVLAPGDRSSWPHAHSEEEIPRVGVYSVLCDGHEKPLCVVFLTDTWICKFNEVDEKHAYEEDQLICERFKVVFK